MQPADGFRDAIRAAGMTPPDLIEPGRFHRFPGIGKSNGNTAGWCKLFPDGMGGIYGDHSLDLAETWQAKRDRPMSLHEREDFRRNADRTKAEAEAKRREDQVDAAKRAAELWNEAQAATGHPYLARKGVGAHGLRIVGNTLLVPMRDSAGKLWNVERISSDGTDKKGLTGGRRTGCYHGIGKADGVICIAEGYATGASVHEATGHAVAVAFNAGNLEAVAQALRQKYPDSRLILCADDDYRKDGNPGVAKATAAARAVGGLLAIPHFGADRPEGATDFNDLAQHQGAEAVERAVANAWAPDDAEGKTATQDAPEGDSGPRVVLLCAADVKSEAVHWHWPEWIAAGKLHILAGPAGTGKTTLAIALAATLTIGGRWPDGTQASVADVVIWSGEDSIADTLAPRLAANGADSARVHFVRSVADDGERRPFDPATDTPLLALALSRLPTPPALLIVDPIVSAVAGDSHKNSETRRSLQPLVDLGERIGCAILGISHFSKGTTGRDPVERVTGSIAFGALARVVLAAVKTTAQDGTPGPRLFARAKSNLGPDGGGFRYSLDQVPLPGAPDVTASRVLWGDAVDGDARLLLAAAESDQTSDEAADRRHAVAWLREVLTGGPLPVKEVRKQADDAGFAWRTVQRAMRDAGVESRRGGFGKPSEWALAPQSRHSRQPLETGATGATGGSGATGEAQEVF